MNSSARTNLSHAEPPDEAAARWLARHDAGLSPEEEQEFLFWQASDPRHVSAWREFESVWQALDEPRRTRTAAAMVQELARRKHRRRWKTSLAVAAGLAAAAAAVVLLLARPDPSRGLISRIEQRVLEDGSVVELDRGTEIEVRFQPDYRRVRLVSGEALFTVAQNHARPFIVSTGRVDVQAVGTAFSVQAKADAVDVVVTEGRVAVERTTPLSGRPAWPATAPVLVGAGDRLLVPAAIVPGERLQVQALPPAEIARRLAWRGPRIELAGTPLRAAVELFNRESHVQLRIADASLADLRLSGVFRADNAEGFARLLEANYEVRTQRRGDEIELRSK